MTPRQESAYRALAAGYRGDPVGYARDVLGATVTPQQAAIAAALAAPPFRVLVPSANNVGKTFAAGWLINHFHDTYDPGIVLATSSSYRQVRTQLFKEVRRLRPFGLGLQPKSPLIEHTPTHFVLGFSTNKADAFQGHHETNLLIVMDEATGVSAEFSDRAETMFQGRAGFGWVNFYNPNDITSAAYAQEQSGGWTICRLSALDHPNIVAELRGEPPPVPGAIRLDRLLARIASDCEPCGHAPADDTCFEFPPCSDAWFKPVSPLFEVQVLGRWPTRSQYAVWSREEWDACLRAEEVGADWPVQIGCDPARGGTNKIAVAVRKGLALVSLEQLPSSLRSNEIAAHLRRLCKRWAPEGVSPREVPVLIDDTGGYGSGICDYPEGHSFHGIVNSCKATDPGKYPNVRSELWWNVKLAADQGGLALGNVATGADLIDQLRGDYLAARYALDSSNRRVVEGKENIAARLGRSPDLADAVALAWYPHYE